MMPKQNPVNPAPLISPSCCAVKPKSAPQFAKIPPRIPKPTPAARMAINPAIKSRLALGAIASLLTCTLLIYYKWGVAKKVDGSTGFVMVGAQYQQSGGGFVNFKFRMTNEQ